MVDNSLEIKKLRLYYGKIPFRNPVNIRGVSCPYKNLLLVEQGRIDGQCLWGEITFLPPTENSVEQIRHWFEHNHHCLWEKLDNEAKDIPPNIKFALFCAIPVFTPIQNEQLDVEIQSNALLAGDKETIIKRAQTKLNQGYSIFKVKIGDHSLTEAIEIVLKISEILGENKKIVIDMNRLWTLDQTIEIIRYIKDLNVLYIEDPVHSVDELAEFIKHSPIKVGMDEFLEYWSPTIEKICEEYQERIVYIIKPSILYGSALWNKLNHHPHTPRVFTSAWETGLGLRQILQIIFEYRQSILFVGLDTYSFFEHDIIHPELPLETPILSKKSLGPHFSIHKDKLKLIYEIERR